MDGFAQSLPFVLRWEGGFVDDPDDPGGRTNKGVTQAVYKAWRAGEGLAPRDVAQIEDAEVAAIYERDYWRRAGAGTLPRKLDLVQFDTAVNMGVGRAVRILQTTLGCTADGAFGPQTAAAVKDCEPMAATRRYCDVREGIYRSIVANRPVMAKFLRGWLNRLNDLRQEALGTRRGPAPPPDFGEGGRVMRLPELADDAPLEAWR